MIDVLLVIIYFLLVALVFSYFDGRNGKISKCRRCVKRRNKYSTGVLVVNKRKFE